MPTAPRSVPSCTSKLAGAFAFALLTSCGSGATEVGILINLASLPTRTARITVKTSLDGKPASMVEPAELSATGLTRFGVTVPTAATGNLSVDLTLLDTDRCTHGNSTVIASLPAARGTQITATVTAKSPRQCDPLLPCADRTLCTQTKAQTNRLWSVWAISNTDVWAVGDASTVLHWDGTTWSPKADGMPAGISLSSVWASAADDVWAVGATTTPIAGYIFRFDGTRWTQTFTGPRFINWIHGTSRSDIFAVGTTNAGATVPGDFRRWNSNTSTWDSINSGVNRDLFAVWANNPNDVWVAGGLGTLLRFNGTSVTPINIGAANDLHAIHGYVTSSGQTIVYAAGLGGAVVRYDGSPRVTAIGVLPLNGVLATADAVYVTGPSGTLYKSQGVADIFTAFSSGPDILYGIHQAPNGIGWVVGGNGFHGYIDTRP